MKRVRAFSLCLSMILLPCAAASAYAQDVRDGSLNDDIPAVKTEGEPAEEFAKGELLPLKRIVLYNSGVGQMHHGGEVDGKTRLEIRFGGHDVNDVLKSLIFHDEAGGTARAVEYQPAPEPEDVAANQIGTPMTLAQLLQRFRGEKVRLTVAGNEFNGTIYGVEQRSQLNETIETLVLINDAGLQTIDLLSIDLVQFESEEIRNNLKLAMAGVVKSRKANQKQLDLLFDGEGKRNITFAYVVDMPIWRMSYRLSAEDDKTTFQGWAYVDNVTGVDWEKVSIELRSGRPQAFHINTFSPILVERPAFGNSAYRFTKGLSLITEQFGVGKQFMHMAPNVFPSFGGSSDDFDITKSFKASATEARASRTVRYELPELANIGAGKSASLPVFTEELPANFISVFDDMDEKSIVYRAIQISNATEYPFISGPVSVVRQGDFVGDGHFNRLNVGEDTEFIYAIDRAMQVDRKVKENDPKLDRIHIEDQAVQLTFLQTTDVTFEITNKDTEARSLRLRFQFQDDNFPERKLLSPEAADTTGGIATFSVDVEAQASQPLHVQLEQSSGQKALLEAVTLSTVNQWKASGATFSDEDKAFLDGLMEVQESIDSWNDQIAAFSKRKKDLGTEQQRVRSNLDAVGADSEAAKFYIDQLRELDSQIQEINTQTQAAQSELEDARKLKADRISQYGN